MRQAGWVERFLGVLFGIEEGLAIHRMLAEDGAVIAEARRQAVQRLAMSPHYKDRRAAVEADPAQGLRIRAWVDPDDQQAFAVALLGWLEDPGKSQEPLEAAVDAIWYRWLYRADASSKPDLYWVPQKHGGESPLSSYQNPDDPSHYRASAWHPKSEFLPETRANDPEAALAHAHYCILCHPRGKDSCRRGLPMSRLPSDAAGHPKQGCPLEQRISEMHALMRQGSWLGAFWLVAADNPMVAATGHRICNDCMQSCIYQKQEPVDIPMVETTLLRSVLDLPWGLELYSLAMRWNPLLWEQPTPRPLSGYRMVVAGLGPAGFTFAHYALRDGHSVVGLEGLKMEPLSGLAAEAVRRPIHDIRTLMSETVPPEPQGFGGVMEYGITSRWDKYFLQILRILLERWPGLTWMGGVRFGKQWTLEDCFASGCDHVALALGAGRPQWLTLPHAMGRGVRFAADFLMALQSGGAFRAGASMQLQMDWPVAVIGGGLTAIDTATEALLYYPRQLALYRQKMRHLERRGSVAEFLAGLNVADRARHDRWIEHAEILAALGADAQAVLKQLRAWGGAVILYRRGLEASPSYRLNPEEIAAALQQGVDVVVHADPLALHYDPTTGDVVGVEVTTPSAEEAGMARRIIPARTVLVAAGTLPHPMAMARAGSSADQFLVMKDAEARRSVSVLGDLHPSFAGNVVKAMASAKEAYRALRHLWPQGVMAAPDWHGVRDPASEAGWRRSIEEQCAATVAAIDWLAPGIVAITVRAPAAAMRWRPGQFFRLQGLEGVHPLIALGEDGLPYRFSSEPMAMTGASVDSAAGTVTMVALVSGASTQSLHWWRPGDSVVCMGPVGEPSPLPSNRDVLLIGGGLGNAVLFSIGQAMRARGCRVRYVAGYRRAADRFWPEQLEAAADRILWCLEDGGSPEVRRGDRVFHGNVLDGLVAHHDWLGLEDVESLMVIGSDRMMRATQAMVRGGRIPGLRSSAVLEAWASVNSPMQCMLGGVCGQCLQRQEDPRTGQVRYVFSCETQDQPLDAVDFGYLADRLQQQSLQERMASFLAAEALEAEG